MAGPAGHLQDGLLARAPAQEANHLIEAALRTAVSVRLGEARFALWFGSGVQFGLTSEGDALEVRVPDSFFREWIQSHYTSSLLEAAETVTGRPLRLSIQINNEADPPLDNIAEPAPVPTAPVPPGHYTNTVPHSSPPLLPHSTVVLQSPRTSLLRTPSLQECTNQPQPPGASNSASSPNGRLAPGLPVRRRLDEFVTGPGNRLAHAAAQEMARSAGALFNPLVIYGAIGLGKTHLLDAIGLGLKQMHPTLHVIQLTAEVFTNAFLEAMRSDSLSSFRARYRTAGGLIVDDVHFLAAKRATQDEFLHTFNALVNRGAPIILAADQHPRSISRLPEELVTRFLGGMVVKIDPPDLTTRRAILDARAAARKINVPNAVIAYIAEHLRSSIRELEGALYTVIAQADLTGKPIDLNLAKTALRETIRHTVQGIALRDIERAICQLFQISGEALKSGSRARALAYPRMLAMFLARKHTTAAYSEIGRHFGGRNHSTVIAAEKKVQSWLQAEQRSALLPGFETVAELLVNLEATLGT